MLTTTILDENHIPWYQDTQCVPESAGEIFMLYVTDYGRCICLLEDAFNKARELRTQEVSFAVR